MAKTVLVTGSTGLQARALVKSLLSSNSQAEQLKDQFKVLALTRNPSGTLAQSLRTECQNDPNLIFVKGNLNEEASLRAIFEEEKKKDSGIWGVHIVLPFPGLGQKVDMESKQGITLASLALEFKVSYVVYSSVARLAKTDGTESHLAKLAVEDHIKSLGENGLPYTIIQPGAFMELFEGSLGPLITAIFRAGLPSNTKVQLIASEDIGNLAGVLFKNPQPYINETILVVGDVLTVNEQEQAYRNATGRARSAAPSMLAKLALKTNSAAKEIIDDIQKEHEARTADTGGFERGINESKAIYPDIMSYETWVKKTKQKAPPKGWNRLSFLSTILGMK